MSRRAIVFALHFNCLEKLLLFEMLARDFFFRLKTYIQCCTPVRCVGWCHSIAMLSVSTVLFWSVAMNTNSFQSCIDACNACANACDSCAALCLKEADVASMVSCIELDMDCALLCRTAATLMARNSDHAAAICKLCAAACQACADECGKHKMDHCQRCAEACRKCADACAQMAAV